MKKNLYKMFYEAKSEQDAINKELEWRANGVDMFDIYRFNYDGNDGKFHREVFVFAE